MNVKSFVNGLDPENTVKGYYDENDQLVMVEPEGSGGGGGYTTIYESETAVFEYVSGNNPQANLDYTINIEDSTLYKITLDGTVLVYAAVESDGEISVNSVNAPDIAIDNFYLYPGVNASGIFNLTSSDNAQLETWAGSTHAVKIERMPF